MYRTFISLVAGAAIAITAIGASARPAAADSDDVARALAALAAIAIIGAAINDSRDDHKVHRPHQPVKPRPLPPRVIENRKLLPPNCLRTYQTRHGKVNAFGRGCLAHNYRHVNRLPQACTVRIRHNHGYARGYAARCLRQHGYRLAHR
ncbi:MAG: hypothetical protein AAGM84_10590 [Pseudomonadota bacterium]